MKKLIVWSVGTNGDGSSQLVSNLLMHIQKNNNKFKILIFISNGSLLDKKLNKLKFKKSKIIKLPGFFRKNIIQLGIKLFGSFLILKKNLIVLDDFPFLDFGLSNQILLLHQPNLCYFKNKSIVWKLKRLAFRIMINPKLKIIIQTEHMANKLLKIYQHKNSYPITHSIL